jgi:hypothetical protein
MLARIFVGILAFLLAGMANSSVVVPAGSLQAENGFLESSSQGQSVFRVVGYSGIEGDIALCDGITNGLVPGPRLRAAGRKITAPGGQVMYLQPALEKQILEQEFLTVSGPEEARKAVRENLAIGCGPHQDGCRRRGWYSFVEVPLHGTGRCRRSLRTRIGWVFELPRTRWIRLPFRLRLRQAWILSSLPSRQRRNNSNR